jgi:hypothetical protein
MKNTFEFGKHTENDNINKFIKRNPDHVGVDDNLDIEKELANRRFINKDKFEIEDLSKVTEIINDLVEKDKKLVSEIEEIKKETFSSVDSFESNFDIDNTQEKLSDENADKFINFLKKVPAESSRRRVLLESRLNISISLLEVFDKSVQLLESMGNYAEDEEESKKFSFAVNAFKIQSQQAKSVYESIKSELLEINEMDKIRSSFFERKKISDYLKNYLKKDK